MNVMTNFDGSAASYDIEETAVEATPTADAFTLRQTGGRPVSFTGSQLAMAMNFAPGCPLWYEINLFRVADGRFIADVRCFRRSENEDDTFTVFEAPNFEAVLSMLEGYDASRDIRFDFDLEDDQLSLADLTFRALALRVRVENARASYRTLLGQVLYDLHQSDL